MDRTEYLKKCQKCAMLKRDTNGVIKNLPDEFVLSYRGIKYYPLSYLLGFDEKGEAIHVAILHDLKANSVVHAYLEKVDKYV